MFETTRVSSKVPTSFPGFSPTRPLGGGTRLVKCCFTPSMSDEGCLK